MSQNKKTVNNSKAKLDSFNNPYNKLDTELYNHLIKLRYDSVKVFNFNREKEETVDFSLVVDTPNIYNVFVNERIYAMLKGSQTTDKGKLISRNDSQALVQILINSNKDYYGKDDPVGIYAPSVGFVFFKLGKACAHLDVAMAYDKIQLEIFNKASPPFQYKRELLGEKTNKFLNGLIKKYKLPKWVLTE